MRFYPYIRVLAEMAYYSCTTLAGFPHVWFRCSVCLERRSPSSTSCGHLFCWRCIQVGKVVPQRLSLIYSHQIHLCNFRNTLYLRAFKRVVRTAELRLSLLK
ncbi:hypothetical protein ANCDUO_13126 [Ancylostoma duodenale]|uniref:RING-type domain-containing protein n=1 Tax=Ancylostoma duodenale TaxID=51022 RepID=A0A0C2GHZ2_9BILA|nr:hypothetical protein ANCDUO_13126 [Ancylostoma duodenale]